MRRTILLLGLAVAAAACGSSPPTSGGPTIEAPPPPTAAAAQPLVVDGPGRYEGEVTSQDRLRRFVLHVPETVVSPAPLVIVFHGFTSNPGRVEELSGMTELADREGFVVAYPAALGLLPAWAADDREEDRDVVFVRDMMVAVAAAVEIDPDRVYATGMSNGGGMAARLACDASDVIAAVGPVAGAYTFETCAPSRPVPVVAFHGTEDFIVPYRGLAPLGLPSIEQWAADRAGGNGCRPGAETEPVSEDVERLVWTGCEADVTLYVVEGGRHGWPGSGRALAVLDSTTTIDASEIMWEFFSRHPRA